MKLLVTFTLYFLTVQDCSTISLTNVSSNKIRRPNGRITGGKQTSPNAIPYQAGLKLFLPNGELKWCGGSIISERFILTAAHCIDEVTDLTVFLALQDIRNLDEDGVIRINIGRKDFIIHEQYDPEGVRNDIALIKLPYDIEFSKKIHSINLPEISDIYQTFEGYTSTASGWGKFSDSNDDISSTLRYINVPILSMEDCYQSYPIHVQYTNICIDGRHKKSACSGDSGGPLVVKGKDGKLSLIGLSSFGANSGCEKGFPSVYTRVTAYLPWISKYTGINLRE